MSKHKSWDDEDTFGADILGIGVYQRIGNPHSKVKTKQIGFIRTKRNDTIRKTKTTTQRRRNRVPVGKRQR